MEDEVTGENSEAQFTETESLPNYEALNEEFNAPLADEDKDSNSNNPAWKPILDELPEEYHDKITPFLRDSDKHVQEVQQKFAPYKDFADRGVSPDVIKQAMQLGEIVSTNPRALFDELQNRYNFTAAEAAQAVNDVVEDNNEDEFGQGFSGEDDFENHPAYKKLESQISEFQREREESRHQEEMLHIQREVASEWDALESKVGKLSDVIKEDVMQRALQIAGADGMPSLETGFREHVKFASVIRNSSANRSAPSVFDGSGALPGGKTYSNDKEGMVERILDRLK